MSKRLVICCDGTWDAPVKTTVSNVVKVARSIEPRDSEGIDQIVFYDWGVGTGGRLDKMTGGGLGKGLDKNIQDAYRFLAHNYCSDDEVYLFGFSRGAYTVRSLIGFIRNCGLVKKNYCDKISDAYDIYRSRSKPDVKEAKEFRNKFSNEISIKFLGVWDTVGALGIPLGIFKKINEKRYSFHDTRISGIVENAYHALAIDERRKPFAPTIWKTKKHRKNVEQVWFAGVHGDVGGGYPESRLSDETLKWMVDKASNCGLVFNMEYIESITNKSVERLHNSYTPGYFVFGPYTRPIGLTNLDESVHPSAIERYHKKRAYTPKNLIEYLNMQKSTTSS